MWFYRTIPSTVTETDLFIVVSVNPLFSLSAWVLHCFEGRQRVQDHCIQDEWAALVNLSLYLYTLWIMSIVTVSIKYSNFKSEICWQTVVVVWVLSSRVLLVWIYGYWLSFGAQMAKHWSLAKLVPWKESRRNQLSFCRGRGAWPEQIQGAACTNLAKTLSVFMQWVVPQPPGSGRLHVWLTGGEGRCGNNLVLSLSRPLRQNTLY